MNNPLISVVIPTYNGKDHLGEAIQSVLDQTYDNFEIIVVDDVSPEDMSVIVLGFADPRVRYIRHDRNRGAVAARKTGVDVSSGEIIAFLDQDDLFHREKLETHANFFADHPDVGLAYNGRFEILGSIDEVCGMSVPPATLTLGNLVLGYPISPSDVVLAREWALREDIWYDGFARQAEHVIFNGQEIVFGGRLALAGCRFANVGRILNYRRLHPYRVLSHLEARCKAELACQDIVFEDERCPDEILALRETAHGNIYLMWAYASYIQKNYELARRLLVEAIERKPNLMDGDPFELLTAWVAWLTLDASDYGDDYENILLLIFENLPEELQSQKRHYQWSVARGHLFKGLQTLIWGRLEDAENYFQRSMRLGAHVDTGIAKMFVSKLLDYETQFGEDAGRKILQKFHALEEKFGRKNAGSFISAHYEINQAFRRYRDGRFRTVPKSVMRALWANPALMLNRGVLSIFFRSLYLGSKGDSPIHYGVKNHV